MTALPRERQDDSKLPEEAIKEFLASHKSGIGRLMVGQFEIQTMEEAEKLSTMLANQYPDPDRVATGIWELISNSVEHGNLEIDFDEKVRLIESGTYADEIARRLRLPKYAERFVLVDFKRTKGAIRLSVCDDGPGFDYSKYFEADYAPDGPNGRGIVIASRLSFDRVVYHGRGNVVDAIINL
jgi:anti-sigma regulatory factor (Ser/Thr protein kinase)